MNRWIEIINGGFAYNTNIEYLVLYINSRERILDYAFAYYSAKRMNAKLSNQSDESLPRNHYRVVQEKKEIEYEYRGREHKWKWLNIRIHSMNNDEIRMEEEQKWIWIFSCLSTH